MDLASEVQDLVVPIVYSDLNKFFEEIIAPYLQGLDIDQIPEDLIDQAVEIIERDLLNYSTFGFEGVPIENDATIEHVEIVGLDDREIRALNDDEVLIKFSGKFEAQIDGFVEKHTYYAEDLDVDIWDANWNEWVMAASTSSVIPVEIGFTYCRPNSKITGYSIHLPTEIDTSMK